MLAVQLSDLDRPAVIGAFGLNTTDVARSDGASAPEAEAQVVSRLWGLVRRLDPVRLMILRAGDHCWVASGTLLVKGQKALNIGFLMPTLRGEMTDPDPAALPMPSLGTQLHHVTWALATRMARVEADRVFLLDTGALLPIRVTRDGFALPAGTGPAALRALLVEAVRAGREIRYSLGTGDGLDFGPTHGLGALFAEAADPPAIRVAEGLWPVAVPDRAGLDDIRLALLLAEGMAAFDADPDCRLQLLGAGSQLIASATREAEVRAIGSKLLESGK